MQRLAACPRRAQLAEHGTADLVPGGDLNSRAPLKTNKLLKTMRATNARNCRYAVICTDRYTPFCPQSALIMVTFIAHTSYLLLLPSWQTLARHGPGVCQCGWSEPRRIPASPCVGCSHCKMYISDAVLKESDLLGTKGTIMGIVYVMLTLTRSPGTLLPSGKVAVAFSVPPPIFGRPSDVA
jgi:hypothetical protein